MVDSLQLASNHKVATPVDWKMGDDVMITTAVKDKDVATLFPKGCTTFDVPSGKKYMRFTPQP